MKFVSLHIPKVKKKVQGALRLFRGHLKWKLLRHSLNQLCFRFILTELVKKVTMCTKLPQNTVIPKPSTAYSPKPLLSTSIAAVMSTGYRLYGIFKEIFTFRTHMFWVNLPPIDFGKRMASHLNICTTKHSKFRYFVFFINRRCYKSYLTLRTRKFPVWKCCISIFL